MVLSLLETFTGTDASYLPIFVPLGVIGFYRLVLFLIRFVCYCRYKAIKPLAAKHSTFTSTDCTIIVPTIDPGEEFRRAAQRWLVNEPYEIIVVTIDSLRDEVESVVYDLDPTKFRVLTVPHANKRRQLVRGINAATTSILALSDDDAIWSTEFLRWMLVPFENPRMGGVGSAQQMTPVGVNRTVWEVIADMRLSMRMMEAAATTYGDGGISCLSGRTAVYRTEILVDPEFQDKFVHEKWRGKYQLTSGDDKFITRWLVSHDWEMRFQYNRAASLKTTFKPNWHFLKQLLRWTRNTWRSDFRSLFIDRYVWRRYPYVAFNMIDKMLNPLTLLYGPTFIAILMLTHPSWSPWTILVSEIMWIVFSRYIRLILHWRRVPKDLIYLPVYIIFNYGFAFLKIYALCTLHVTGWQTREGAEDDIEESESVAVAVAIGSSAAGDTSIQDTKKQMSVRSKPSRKRKMNDASEMSRLSLAAMSKLSTGSETIGPSRGIEPDALLTDAELSVAPAAA